MTTATSGVLARFPLLLPVRNSFASYGASAVTRTSDRGHVAEAKDQGHRSGGVSIQVSKEALLPLNVHLCSVSSTNAEDRSLVVCDEDEGEDDRWLWGFGRTPIFQSGWTGYDCFDRSGIWVSFWNGLDRWYFGKSFKTTKTSIFLHFSHCGRIFEVDHPNCNHSKTKI